MDGKLTLRFLRKFFYNYSDRFVNQEDAGGKEMIKMLMECIVKLISAVLKRDCQPYNDIRALYFVYLNRTLVHDNA